MQFIGAAQNAVMRFSVHHSSFAGLAKRGCSVSAMSANEYSGMSLMAFLGMDRKRRHF